MPVVGQATERAVVVFTRATLPLIGVNSKRQRATKKLANATTMVREEKRCVFAMSIPWQLRPCQSDVEIPASLTI
jgi:hypothetical protein